jgi:hypothetical protein
MATPTDIPGTPHLAADIRSLLARLRRRIRVYVWIDGLALGVIWLGATFWIGLAIDYLPVMLGASEMPRGARLLLLVVIGLLLAMVLYRSVLRRAFARLPDHSMAVLVERRFERFHDALVTAVELAEQPEHARQFNPDMLARTRSLAESQAERIRVREIFRLGPLALRVALAAALVGSIGLLYAVDARVVQIWAQRLYLLSDQPWPRSTHVEVAGIQIQHTPAPDGVVSLSELMTFDQNREIKVAKGTSVVLLVQADATKVVPDVCTVYYRTEENDRGSVNLQKFGRIRDGVQPYTFDGKPFRGILSSITFDVRGNDHRVRDYHLTVVPSPTIIDTQLECVFPDYMVDERLSLWLPRTIDLASGTQLPHGTRITLHARSNKDLTQVDIYDPQSDRLTTLPFSPEQGDRRQFEYVVESLAGDLVLEMTLHDTDRVVSDPPIRLQIGGVEDQPPVVQAGLRGIGTAVTPDVVIPAQGRIVDDYDVDRAWFDVAINDGAPHQFPFPLSAAGQVDAALDFRAQRALDGGLTLQPKDKLAITLMASDRCTVGDGPNLGSGDRYQLDVVTADELLAMLERRELGLRRRLEQIIEEVTEMRDSLGRIRRATDTAAGTAPEESLGAGEMADPDSAPDDAESADPSAAESREARAAALRLLRTQRAGVQNEKSTQEVLGVAASFDDIRAELINNRIDSEDRKERLQQQIAEPLRRTGETRFPLLADTLRELEQQLPDPAASDRTVDVAVQQTDAILLELESVLQKMLELETFNELMGIIRSLIEDQNQVMDKTKQERANQARELLK